MFARSGVVTPVPSIDSNEPMPDTYYFFFSYATLNRVNAKWELRGNSGNYLDEFFSGAPRKVSDLAGSPAALNIYRDRERIKLGEYWGHDLVQALQKARRAACADLAPLPRQQELRRELGFFHRRLKEFARVAGGTASLPPRILPIFWEDSDVCFKRAHPRVAAFLRALNFYQKGLPDNYPAVGLSQICKLRPGTAYESLVHTLAARIVELVDMPDVPPPLSPTGPGDFSDLESVFAELEREGSEDVILGGPGSTNIVYLVGTRSEMQAAGLKEADRYGEKREGWRPFEQAPARRRSCWSRKARCWRA